MDRDNKREITISIPEPIYEELQNAAKQLSGWEREQLQGTEREISDSWEPGGCGNSGCDHMAVGEERVK